MLVWLSLLPSPLSATAVSPPTAQDPGDTMPPMPAFLGPGAGMNTGMGVGGQLILGPGMGQWPPQTSPGLPYPMYPPYPVYAQPQQGGMPFYPQTPVGPMGMNGGGGYLSQRSPGTMRGASSLPSGALSPSPPGSGRSSTSTDASPSSTSSSPSRPAQGGEEDEGLAWWAVLLIVLAALLGAGLLVWVLWTWCSPSKNEPPVLRVIHRDIPDLPKRHHEHEALLSAMAPPSPPPQGEPHGAHHHSRSHG